MLIAFARALRDLADPRIVAILLRSLLLTLMIFLALGLLCGWALTGADPCGWVDVGSCVLGRGGGTLGAILLLVAGLWFLFPAIALGVITGFMDRVVTTVEQRDYPAATARPLGLARGAWLGLVSGLRLLVYNLIAAPFYLLLLVTGIGPLLLFLAVNGVALGHDLVAMVALRHGSRADSQALLRATRGERWLLGTIVTALFLLPFLNLLAPLFGAAAATHLVHRRISAKSF